MKKVLTIALLLSATLGQAATKFATRTYELTNFIEIVVNNSVKVIYTQGEPYSVKLTGRADWLDLMKVSTTADVLNVVATRTKKFNNVKKKDLPDGQHIFILHLTAPCLQKVDLRGASSFEAKSMTPDRFDALLDGASTMLIDEIDTPKFYIRLKGASTFKGQQIKCDEMMDASLLGASQASIKSATAPKSDFNISHASKFNLTQLNGGEDAAVFVYGASEATVNVEASKKMQISLSGASKGRLTFKGGRLLTGCTGASKLHADVNCTDIQAKCDGASKITFTGTADKVEIDSGGVATNIDTSRLNQY